MQGVEEELTCHRQRGRTVPVPRTSELWSFPQEQFWWLPTNEPSRLQMETPWVNWMKRMKLHYKENVCASARGIHHGVSEEAANGSEFESGQWVMVVIQRLVPRHLRVFGQIFLHQNLVMQRVGGLDIICFFSRSNQSLVRMFNGYGRQLPPSKTLQSDSTSEI